MRGTSLLLLGSVVMLTGCKSAFIQTTVINNTEEQIELLEVDYPSASFGTENLVPGAQFHYRFKVLGSGVTKLLWTDAAHKDHTLTGPALKEDDEGSMTITFTPAGPKWVESIHTR